VHSGHEVTRPTYHASIGSQSVDLPIVALSETVGVALLITVDLGISFCERAGQELAHMLDGLSIDVVVSVATMGIPFAVEVAKALGHDQYAILHKTPKIHLGDAVSEPVQSITTAMPQRLLFDRARIPVVQGRRVALIDDVISTGSSAVAALKLLRGIGAEPMAIGAIVTEGDAWRTTLGDDATRVHALSTLPLFRPRPDGGFDELDATTPKAEVPLPGG
jgi:adenine/guanine phosphoribosyltransferase-like PRPP-binding protein